MKILQKVLGGLLFLTHTVDLLLCDHSCISGDIALRIQHDVSRRHTKTSKWGHPLYLTSGITSFSLGYNSLNNEAKTPLRN